MAIFINPKGRCLVQAAIRNNCIIAQPHICLLNSIEPFVRETPATEFIAGFAVECQASPQAIAAIESASGSMADMLASVAATKLPAGTDIIIRKLT